MSTLEPVFFALDRAAAARAGTYPRNTNASAAATESAIVGRSTSDSVAVSAKWFSSLIHTSSSALCSNMPRSRAIESGRRRFERSRGEPHLPIRMKSTFRLQRQRFARRPRPAGGCRRGRPARLRTTSRSGRCSAMTSGGTRSSRRRIHALAQVQRATDFACGARRLRAAPTNRRVGRCSTRHAASDSRAARGLRRPRLPTGTPAATCRPQRNEHVGTRRRTAIARHPAPRPRCRRNARAGRRVTRSASRAPRRWRHRSCARSRDRRASPPPRWPSTAAATARAPNIRRATRASD